MFPSSWAPLSSLELGRLAVGSSGMLRLGRRREDSQALPLPSPPPPEAALGIGGGGGGRAED